MSRVTAANPGPTWNGIPPMPDGYSDGLYYVRGKLGNKGVNTWIGPCDTLQTAQAMAVKMYQEWAYTFDTKLRSASWLIEIGKRSWQVRPHVWQLYPEDSITEATYREGLRAGTGVTASTYVKPSGPVAYTDDTYHGFFPEDYAPVEIYDAPGPAYIGKAYRTFNSGLKGPMTVGVATGNGELPAVPNQTVQEVCPMPYQYLNPEFVTPQKLGALGAAICTQDALDNDPIKAYWVDPKNGYGDYSSCANVIVMEPDNNAARDCSGLNSAYELVVTRPDTPYPDDDYSRSIVGPGQFTEKASNGLFLSACVVRTLAVRRMAEVARPIVATFQQSHVVIPGVVDSRGDDRSPDAQYDDVSVDPPYQVFNNVNTQSGADKLRVSIKTTATPPTFKPHYVPFGTLNSIPLLIEKLGAAYVGTVDTYAGTPPAPADVPFPAYPIKQGDTQFNDLFGHVNYTNVCEVDIEVRAVYVKRTAGIGSEVYHESTPNYYTVAMIPNAHGALTVREAYNLPLPTPTAIDQWPGMNNTVYYFNTVGGLDGLTSAPCAVHRFTHVVGDKTTFAQPFPFWTENRACYLSSVGEGGSLFPWKNGLDPSKYVINETYQNHSVTRKIGTSGQLSGTFAWPSYQTYTAKPNDYSMYFDNQPNYGIGPTNPDPFTLGMYSGSAQLIIGPFEQGSSLDYETLSPGTTLAWTTQGFGVGFGNVGGVYGGVSGVGGIGVGPVVPVDPQYLYYKGTISGWLVQPLDKQGVPPFDNSDGFQYDGSAQYRTTLDDGRIFYYGVGNQFQNGQIKNLPGKSIVGYNNSEREGLPGSETLDFLTGPWYASGPYTFFINSDDNSTLVNEDNGGKYPNPDDDITVGSTYGPELGALGTIRRETKNGDIAVRVYDRPQRKGVIN